MALPSMAMFAQYYISCVAYLLALPTGILSGVTEPLELRQNRNLPCENTLSQLTFHTPSTGRTGKFTPFVLTVMTFRSCGKNLLVSHFAYQSCSRLHSVNNFLIGQQFDNEACELHANNPPRVCEGVWSSSLEEHWWSQRLCRHTLAPTSAHVHWSLTEAIKFSMWRDSSRWVRWRWRSWVFWDQ